MQIKFESEAIEVDPDKCGGLPVLRGTRFTVAQLIAELADGHSMHRIAFNFCLNVHDLEMLLHDLAISLGRK